MYIKSKMANLKIRGLLWMLLISVTSLLFPKINAYQCSNVVIDEDLSEQINSGEVDTKISQVPYMASYGYEGEFY